MLYSNDEYEGKEIVSIEYSKNLFNKKIIICAVIILACIIITIVSFIMLKKYNEKHKEDVKVNQNITNNVVEVYKPKHIQIERHNISKIKNQFLPQHKDNAQELITNIYYSEEKVAYLTFDDGPSKDITPQVLDILKQENVPATFFVLGSRVELYPQTLVREYEEGHYIANHGYSHEYSKIYTSKDTVFEEYVKCENVIKNALGNQDYNTYLFRFPGGSSGGKYNKVKSEAKELLHNYGVNFTNWNCLTGDAAGNTDHDSLMEELKETMEGNRKFSYINA